MPTYDLIGQKYSRTRVPDSRIVDALIELLNLPKGSTIADVGAGTGGYSRSLANQGFLVYAIEPSSVMRKQAQQHPQIEWFTGYAEALPLPDNSGKGSDKYPEYSSLFQPQKSLSRNASGCQKWGNCCPDF